MSRLLVLDDDPEFQRVLREWAKEISSKIEVLSLATEVQFVRWILDPVTPLPDLILLDVKIPVTSVAERFEILDVPDSNGGLRCLERLRHSPRHSEIPAYLLSNTPPADECCISKHDGEQLRKILGLAFGREAST